MEHLQNEVKESLLFEKGNWTNGSVAEDSFYIAPEQAVNASPGSLLKLERAVDTSKYLIPPATALSRFMYQSETLRGCKVPVSGYILWPYSPRALSDGSPVVAWAHGTSGFDANAAPSHHKNLWQHFLAAYQLVLQGYVVVATDYAGLGVREYPSGKPIVHEYLAPPSQSGDIIHSITAARAAFPVLSRSFVVIGPSQGGGAAWSVAQKAALQPISGYLGAVAISPYTTLVNEQSEFSKVLAVAMSRGIASAFPEFNPQSLLTVEGTKRLDTVHQDKHFQQYQEMTSVGGQAIKGPLLVAHGKKDPVLSASVVENAVRITAGLHPTSQIQYAAIPNVTHVSALAASQRLWMDWIGDRFAGRAVEPAYFSHELVCARPDEAQQSDQNW